MKKECKSIIHALSTVFFQEGFDRKEGKHGLEYWQVSEEELADHCRQCRIYGSEEDCFVYCLNTTKINGQWFLRVFYKAYDDYGNFEELKTKLLLPVDTERLCWEVLPRCAELIELTLFPNMDY